jgi:hypothetical protein
MFPAFPHPSSGAYNYISSLWFYRWNVAVAVLLVVVWHCQIVFGLKVIVLTLSPKSKVLAFAP